MKKDTNTVQLHPHECLPACCVFAGETQQSSDTSGSLISSFKSVGNLIRLQLAKQAGEWSLKMMSTHPYTLRVIGKSPDVAPPES